MIPPEPNPDAAALIWDQLKVKAAALPDSAGVYLMKDGKGRVLYVGKAKSLPRRVASYFHKDYPSVRIGLMLAQVRDIDFIVTDTEKEALILENSLIKKHRPRYNVILRDDKTYPSIRLTTRDEWPRLEVIRRVEKDGSVYFGPFTSATALRRTIRDLRRLFPLRQCRRPNVQALSRPCLNHQLGRCLGPCQGQANRQEYDQVVQDVILFFQGRNQTLTESLTERMAQAAEDLDFEAAARFRDRLRDVARTVEQQKMVSPDRKDRDVWALARDRGAGLAVVLHVRQGSVLGRQIVTPTNAEGDPADVLEALIVQYYQGDRMVPEEVLAAEDLPNRALIEEWLTERRGRTVRVKNPQRGPKRHLGRLAQENADQALAEKTRAASLGTDAVEELAAKLGLPGLPGRIEGYDLSTLRGEAAVGAMVVWEDGGWAKGEYRRFRIKSASGQDDYAMMSEIIGRRLAKTEEYTRPDLILLDGGRGQLGVALAVVQDLGLTDPPPMAGLAKGREEGEADKVWLPGRKNPVDFRADSPGLLLLMKIRDESHRYVQAFHHRTRKKGSIRSVLMDIPGLGPGRRKAMLKQFGSVQAIGEAALEDLQAVKGMNRKAALAVHAFFHPAVEPPGDRQDLSLPEV